MASTSINSSFQFLLKPNGKIQTARGLKIAITLIFALSMGLFTTDSEVGLSVGLASIFFLLSDVGGFYTTRAITLLFTIITCTILVGLGTFVSGILILKLLFTFCSLFLAGYIALYGHPGVMAGIVIGILTLFNLNLPSGDWILASQRIMICLIAGGWTLLLSLAIWPVNPYLPLKKSVSRCYKAIAEYINSSRFNSSEDELKRVAKLRASLQTARQTWAFNRQLRLGNIPIGEAVIILLQDADNLINAIVNLSELVQLYRDDEQFITVNILINNALDEIANLCNNLSKLILNQSADIDLSNLKQLSIAISQQKQLQQQIIEDHVEDYPALVVMGRLISILDQVVEQLECTVETADQMKNNLSLTHPRKQQIISSETEALLATKQATWWEALRDNFTLKSNFFRHGLRLAIAITLGVVIYTLANLPVGYWISVTILVVLQPDFGSTFQRFFHRVLGTVIGAIITPILWVIIPSQLIFSIINISSIILGFSLVPYHYGLGVFFISIFAIGLEMSREGGDWRVAMIRFLCTCVGGALAFITAFLLFRDGEKEHLSNQLAKALEASHYYFIKVMEVYLGKTEYNLSNLNKERQKVRLVYFNTQATLQRFSSDPQTSPDELEPRIALLIYLHRFSRSITVLLSQLEQFSGSQPPPELGNFVEKVDQIFTQFAHSISTGNVPPSLPNLEPSIKTIQTYLQELQATRLEEFATHQENTLTREILKDYTILGIELNQISNSIKSIQSTLIRMSS